MSGKTTSFPAWRINVRAIALGLEALRKVDRSGIARGNEQYTGFRALGSGIEMPAAQMAAEEALEFLRIHAGWAYGPDYVDPEDTTGLTAKRRRSCIPTPEARPLTSRGCRRPGSYSMESGRERRGEARQGDSRNGRSRTIRGAAIRQVDALEQARPST